MLTRKLRQTSWERRGQGKQSSAGKGHLARFNQRAHPWVQHLSDRVPGPFEPLGQGDEGLHIALGAGGGNE